jgi:hypothetical protein
MAEQFLPKAFAGSRALSDNVDEPLHPVVQLKFGEEPFLVEIPPEHLQEFIYISQWAADEVTLVFMDRTFGQLEQQIFAADREKRPIVFRWGYPGNGLEQGRWHKLFIETYQPTISHAGLRISITGKATGSEFATIVEPRVYRGKVSSVVQQIADEMKFPREKQFIEETDDEDNEVKQQPWYNATKTRMDMITYLLDQARSKSNNPGPYRFRLSTEGRFHFHTPQYKKIKQEVHGTTEPQNQRKYRRFNVLFGTPNGIISFTPRYEAISIGTFAQRCVAGTVDPRSKQYQQRILQRDVLGLTSSHDPKSGGRTTQPAPDNETDEFKRRGLANAIMFEPTQSVGLGGRCAGKTTSQVSTPEMAQRKMENAYKEMHKALSGGSLELVGLPEYANFSATEEWAEIAVILPEGAPTLSGLPSGLHWSSGRYHLETVTHVITTGYIITAEMNKMTMLDGPSPAKTGPRTIKAPVPTTAAQFDPTTLV